MNSQLLLLAYIVGVPLSLYFAVYAVRMAIITYLDLSDFYDKKNNKGDYEID